MPINHSKKTVTFNQDLLDAYIATNPVLAEVSVGKILNILLRAEIARCTNANISKN